MNDPRPLPFGECAGFHGELADGASAACLLAWLENIEDHASGREGELVYRLRNRIFRLPAPSGTPSPEVCLKWFRPPSLFRSLYYARYPGKAEKSFRYSIFLKQHGVGVPQPLAWGRKVSGGRMRESFLLTEYVPDPTDFLGEMARLYREDPDYVTFLALMRTVADAIRRMHDAGFMHNDLGGQNILVERQGFRSWGRVRFIDLNRGAIFGQLSLRQRARDVAKLDLPSFLRDIFFHFYFGDAPIPREFARWQAFYRGRIDLHNRSRKYRHPIRHLVHRKRQIVNLETVPPHRELWLWDEKSGQPAILLKSRDRNRHRAPLDALRVAGSSLFHAPSIWRHYRRCLEEAWNQPVRMHSRAGVSLEVQGPDLAGRFALLDALEGIPVMIRCHHHLGHAGLEASTDAIRRLSSSGHEVSLALIQSRESIRHPDRWSAFVLETLERLHSQVRFVEIGHAINRVKWGAWDLGEMGRLWEVVGEVRRRYPGLTLLGPPVNDFEFHYYPPLLARWKDRFDAVSCHLYVDRRGAPESFQGPFSTLEKCALGRAIARAFGMDAFHVTEVNWPLTGSGDHSPVQASYNLPGTPDHPLHVDERTAAAYMIRFYLISLCSGLSERVWWWRLSARGFGLADDRDGHRKRVGWHCLAFFHRHFGTATFLRHEVDGPARVFHFDRGWIAYSLAPVEWRIPEEAGPVHRLDGSVSATAPGQSLQLGGEPVFVLSGNAGDRNSR